METILLVDDEIAILDGQESLLKLNGYGEIRKARSGADAHEIVQTEDIALALVDLTLAEESGLDVLRWMRAHSPDTVLLVMTGVTEIETAVECMRAGAYDFLVKGSDTSRLPAAVKNALSHRQVLRENARLREALVRPTLRHPEAFRPFLTRSDLIRRLFHYLEAVATTPDPLLITGETGVGKEVIARAVHEASGLPGPFLPVNLGGLDDHMVTDTLFGHTKGAFTGAQGAREGLIKSAKGGTLFLDEFGELSLESQTKLLRLLDSGEYMPLGSDKSAKSAARLVLATNRDLPTDVEQGRFRKDLYYRISAHEVCIPPLRERPEDIEPILTHLIALHSERLNQVPVEVDETLLTALRKRSLPGNVRELEQLVLSALISGRWNGLRDRELNISEEQLEKEDSGGAEPAKGPVDQGMPSDGRPVRFGRFLPTPSEAIEELLREADKRFPENRSEAAAAIGLSPQAFANRWRRLMDYESDT